MVNYIHTHEKKSEQLCFTCGTTICSYCLFLGNVAVRCKDCARKIRFLNMLKRNYE